MKKISYYLKKLVIGSAWLTVCNYTFSQTMNDEVRMLHRSLWAHYLQYSGDKENTQAWYNELLDAPCSPYVYKGYLQFLYASERAAEVVAMREKIEQIFKDDAEVQLMLALSLKKAGHAQQADDLLVRLSMTFGDHAEIVFYATDVLVQRKDLDNALSLLTNFINRSSQRPNIFVYYFLKAQISMQMGKYDDALRNITLCLEKHSKFDKGWLLMGLINEQAGNIADAVKGYTHYLELSDEPSSDIKQHLAQLMLRQQNGNLMFAAQTENHYYQALGLYRQKQYAKALEMLDMHDKKSPKDTEARLLRVQLLLDSTQVQAALALLSSWMQEDVHNEIWYKALFLIGKNKPYSRACATILYALHEKFPDAPLPLRYGADLCTRAGDMQRAGILYEKIIATTNDESLKAKALFQLSALYYDAQKYDKLAALLEQHEKSAHTFAPLCNMYAYFYATKGKNLDKAHMFAQATQKLVPNNPHFIDTQALIAYKKGEYARACSLLEQLCVSCPHDSTIYIHQAKTYFRLGKQPQALAMIKKAAPLAKNEYEQARIQRLATRWKN